MKLAIIVTNAGQAANCEGGRCETRITTFDLPQHINDFLAKKQKDGYNTINVELVEE